MGGAGFAPESQSLFWDGSDGELSNYWTLADLGIQTGSTLLAAGLANMD
jgi:hypothetical protein